MTTLLPLPLQTHHFPPTVVTAPRSLVVIVDCTTSVAKENAAALFCPAANAAVTLHAATKTTHCVLAVIVCEPSDATGGPEPQIAEIVATLPSSLNCPCTIACCPPAIDIDGSNNIDNDLAPVSLQQVGQYLISVGNALCADCVCFVSDNAYLIQGLSVSALALAASRNVCPTRTMALVLPPAVGYRYTMDLVRLSTNAAANSMLLPDVLLRCGVDLVSSHGTPTAEILQQTAADDLELGRFISLSFGTGLGAPANFGNTVELIAAKLAAMNALRFGMSQTERPSAYAYQIASTVASSAVVSPPGLHLRRLPLSAEVERVLDDARPFTLILTNLAERLAHVRRSFGFLESIQFHRVDAQTDVASAPTYAAAAAAASVIDPTFNFEGILFVDARQYRRARSVVPRALQSPSLNSAASPLEAKGRDPQLSACIRHFQQIVADAGGAAKQTSVCDRLLQLGHDLTTQNEALVQLIASGALEQTLSEIEGNAPIVHDPRKVPSYVCRRLEISSSLDTQQPSPARSASLPGWLQQQPAADAVYNSSNSASFVCLPSFPPPLDPTVYVRAFPASSPAPPQGQSDGKLFCSVAVGAVSNRTPFLSTPPATGSRSPVMHQPAEPVVASPPKEPQLNLAKDSDWVKQTAARLVAFVQCAHDADCLFLPLHKLRKLFAGATKDDVVQAVVASEGELQIKNQRHVRNVFLTKYGEGLRFDVNDDVPPAQLAAARLAVADLLQPGKKVPRADIAARLRNLPGMAASAAPTRMAILRAIRGQDWIELFDIDAGSVWVRADEMDPTIQQQRHDEEN